MIAIGGADVTGEYASYSNRSDAVDFLAPGGTRGGARTDQLYGHDGTKSYRWENGTSGAAPLATGVISLMPAVNPKLSPTQMKQLLVDTAIDKEIPGKDNKTGYGLIDAAAAVMSAKSKDAGADPVPHAGMDRSIHPKGERANRVMIFWTIPVQAESLLMMPVFAMETTYAIIADSYSFSRDPISRPDVHRNRSENAWRGRCRV